MSDEDNKDMKFIDDMWKLRSEMGDCRNNIRDEMYSKFTLKKDLYTFITVVIFVAGSTVVFNNYMNKQVSKEVSEGFEKSVSRIVKALEDKK